MKVAVIAALPPPYAASAGGPICSWIDEYSTEKPFDEAIADLRAAAPEGTYVLVDVLEIDEVDPLSVGKFVAGYLQKSYQRHLNIAWLYHYDLTALKMVRRDGLLSGSIPAPGLTADDVEQVLVALTRASVYAGQKIVAYAGDGTRVSIDGAGVVERKPDAIQVEQ